MLAFEQDYWVEVGGGSTSRTPELGTDRPDRQCPKYQVEDASRWYREGDTPIHRWKVREKAFSEA